MVKDSKISAQLSKINAYLQEQIHLGVPGISAAIATSRGQWLLTAGAADLTTEAPIETDHLFGIGSITKVFVAVVVLQLNEEGKVDLGQRVDEFLGEEIWNGIENARGATVKALLSHRAGIDSWEDDPVWIRRGRGSGVDGKRIWAKTDTLDFIRRPRKTAPEPGQWYYSNTNYTLLGFTIEKITGNNVETEIRRRILEPLGMERTYLDGFDTIEEPRSPNRYHWATKTFRETAGLCPSFPVLREGRLVDCSASNLSVSWVAGGMISCPSDLVKFAAALKQDGKLLKPESLATMKDFRPTGNERLGDMGHGLFRVKSGERTWLGHSGGVLGFSAGLWWTENGDCTVCMLSNVGVVNTGGSEPSGAQCSGIMNLALGLADER